MGSVSPSRVRSWTSSLMTIRIHNLLGHEGAVLIPLDLLVHDGFGLAHADTQRSDYHRNKNGESP
jgi:hypothetical protein